MPIKDNINTIKPTLGLGVELVAVSKFQPAQAIAQAYAAGQRIFGESRPQELANKWQELPKDIEWHFIGHLQRNKVALIAPFVALIQSVDSRRLLDEISVQGVKANRVLKVLLEVHIAQESSKQGFSYSQAREILEAPRPAGIEIAGLMAMATYTQDEAQIGREMDELKRFFDQFAGLTVLSMGMSQDYQVAIEHGSTMVRIGTAIFGSRTT